MSTPLNYVPQNAQKILVQLCILYETAQNNYFVHVWGTPLLLGPAGLTRAGGSATSPPGASSAQAGTARRCRCLKPPRATAHPTAPPYSDARRNSAGRVVSLSDAHSCASCGVRRWSTDPGALVPFMFLFSLVGGKAPPEELKEICMSFCSPGVWGRSPHSGKYIWIYILELHYIDR